MILAKVGEGWTFHTAPDLGPKLRQMMTETRRLPRAVMKTLVLIALPQPVTRSEIEDIRGVGLAQTTMDFLLESALVKPWGRKDAPGRPTLWVTTPHFLSQFGLRSLRDLPSSHLTCMNTDSPAGTIKALAPAAGSQIADVTEPMDKSPQPP